jgi:hypothetical protein
MNKFLLLAVVVLLVHGIAMAETKPWEISVDANVTLTLNTYSNSWTGDETGSFSWASQLILLANKQLIDWLRSENTLQLGFGQSKLQDTTDEWTEFQVSTDKIDFETVERFTFGGWVDPYIAGRLQTQFLNGIPENQKVQYVNPLIFTESFGIARNFIEKENQMLSSRFGGAVYQRVNRKIDNTNDGGLELVTKYNVSTKSNTVTYTLFLNLYQALFSSEDDPKEKWKTVDVDWQNNLTMNITKYLMVNFMFQLLYDRDISEDARTRQTLSLGLTFKYKNNEKKEGAEEGKEE